MKWLLNNPKFYNPLEYKVDPFTGECFQPHYFLRYIHGHSEVIFAFKHLKAAENARRLIRKKFPLLARNFDIYSDI